MHKEIPKITDIIPIICLKVIFFPFIEDSVKNVNRVPELFAIVYPNVNGTYPKRYTNSTEPN